MDDTLINELKSIKDEIQKSTKNILSRISSIETKIKTIEGRFESLETKVESIERVVTKKPNRSDELRPLIKEKLVIKDDVTFKKRLTKYMNQHSVEADIKIFKEYYVIEDETNNIKEYISPIKTISARKYQYWYDNKWIDDPSAYQILKILTYNIQKIYRRLNNINNIDDNASSTSVNDKIEENQKYIENMNTDKYNKLLYKELRAYLNVISN